MNTPQHVNSVYETNRGINADVEFYGIKGQYLVMLAVGLILSFFVFVGLYVGGIHIVFCLLVLAGGVLASYLFTSKRSRDYGTQGIVRAQAQRRFKRIYHCNGRSSFYNLNNYEKN